MPTKRIIYTQDDIRELLARVHRVPIERVTLPFGDPLYWDCMGGYEQVTGDTYIFQVEK